MKTSTTSQHQKIFWDFSSVQSLLKESERLNQIKKGFTADLFQAVRMTFDLQEHVFKTLFNVSFSTLNRRRREGKPLDSVASERLDRIIEIFNLAHRIFESRELASEWMSVQNISLGKNAPIMLCETEIGAMQIRRVLQAFEWGGAA